MPYALGIFRRPNSASESFSLWIASNDTVISSLGSAKLRMIEFGKNPPSSSSDRIGCVFITASDYSELQRKVEMAVNRLQVLDENGNDMLIRDMYLNQPPYKMDL